MPERGARRSLTLLLVAVLALALAACTGDPDERPAPPATTPTAATATATPTAPPTTATPTPTPAPTETPLPSPTATPTPSPTSTATPTPTPTGPPTTFRYHTYDTTGEVAEPGSYAFLADAGDARSAVTTYEGLRDGTATALRIHETDADGVSRAAFLDTVEVGDLFEWRQAEDCWTRYVVTDAPEPSMTPWTLLAVKWTTYAATGCTGAIAADAAARVGLNPPPFTSDGIAVPVRHGPYLLHPVPWDGELEVQSRPSFDGAQGQDASEHVVSSDLAVVRAHPFWREPDLPDGWTLHMATVGLEGIDGYWALYLDARGGIGAEIWVTRPPLLPKYIRATDGASIYEARTIDGHPARVRYSPAGDLTHRTSAAIFDEATGIEYLVVGISPRASGLPDIVIAAARSLYREATSFHYHTYDTTGEVTEPGSYAFLANPADTTSAVTTYEGLRDDTATALRIHETDADGVSRAAFLDTVEVGNLFEWREGDDCFVRYRVTELLPDPSGTPRRLLGVEWMTYAFTGCSGAVSANADASIGWAPPPVTSPDITSPIRHGPFLLIPSGWAGELEARQAPTPPVAARNAPGDLDDPAPTWPSTDIAEIRRHPLWSEPDVPEGWTRFYAEAGADWIALRYQDRDRHGYVEIQLSQGFPLPLYNRHIETSPYGGRIHEATEIDGRPATLWYTPTNDSGLSVTVQVYDDARAVRYRVIAAHWRLTRDYEAVIAIARSLYLDDGPPTPTGPTTTFRYDSYDTTGEVAEPGSYAFLADPGDTRSAVTTYEGLRDGTATALRIHETDAEGVSRAAFLDTVEVGDLFEWRQAEDCWTRYVVTDAPEPSGPPRRLLAVEWMTFTYTGCSGAISASDNVQIVWGPLPNLGGESLSVPVIHGAYEIVPLDWSGETMRDYVPFPDYSDPVETDDITVARTLDFWREPTIPEGWTFGEAIAAGGDAYGGARWGYCATWWAKDVKIPNTTVVHPQRGVQICADFTSTRYGNQDASWNNGSAVHETRVIAGRPASLRFSPPGPNHRLGFPTLIQVFDPTTGVTYEIEAIDYDLKSNPEAVVEMARSLFEPPNPLPPQTAFRYDRYDTTGAVAEPGSYAFLADPADTTSAVTTYEGLRDGSATALRIHETDADGVSRAAFLDTVEVGDLFEWREAEDCWVRYMVTSMPAASGTSTRAFGIKSFTDAYAGCSGVVAVDGDRGIDWSPPVISSRTLTSPLRHGLYHLIPGSWAGATAEPVFPPVPDDVAAIRDLLCCDEPHPWWRAAEVPEGWALVGVTWGGETDPTYGYSAWYRNEHGEAGVEILVGYRAGE